jgi:predicted dinucleotide-binding enzyme
MNIGIIGTGNVGTALTKACIAAGHTVWVSSLHFADAQGLANVTGATAVDSNAAAVAEAELVILAIPYSALAEVAVELRNDLAGRIVVELSNPVASDLDHRLPTTSAAEELADIADEARVVKAFNTVLAAIMGTPVVEGVRLDGLFATDDDYARQQMERFLASIEYEPLYCGPLIVARVLEDMGLLNVRLNSVNGWQWQTAWKLVGVR